VIQIVVNRDDVQGYAAKTVFEVRRSYMLFYQIVLTVFCLQLFVIYIRVISQGKAHCGCSLRRHFVMRSGLVFMRSQLMKVVRSVVLHNVVYRRCVVAQNAAKLVEFGNELQSLVHFFDSFCRDLKTFLCSSGNHQFHYLTGKHNILRHFLHRKMRKLV